MSALTAAELALLRTHPHEAKLYLAIWRPATVLACQVNDASIARSEREITYDNVTAGEYGAVVAGMTLLVGTMAGLSDIGKIRVKSATDTVITVAQNDDIDWSDGLYLTVQNNYELWSKKPRIVESGGSLTRYIDYDTIYAYQTERQNPVPIMGPPACAFRSETTGLATVEFVGEDSYSVADGKTIDTYSWVFPSGTPSTSSNAGTAAAPVEVTWETAGGHVPYVVSLEVRDVGPNDTAGTGRRPVFIFDRTGANAPYTDFEVQELSGDYGQGGWTGKFKVFGSTLTAANFPDGGMVVLFAEEWYGATKQSIGGYPGRENIKFVGYIRDNSVHVNPQSGNAAGYVTFEASTIDGLMKNRDGYATTLEYDTTPSSWNEVDGLDVDMAAYYVAQWFSNLLLIADMSLSGDARKINKIDMPKADLYRQIDDYCSTAIRARLIADKQGCLHLDINPQFLGSTDRDAVATVISLTSQDWRDQLNIPKAESDTSYVECQGKYFDGSAETAFIAEAPGTASQQQGIEEPYTGFVFGGQTDANNMAGYVLAEANNEYPDVPVSLAGNYSFADIVPEWYKLTVAATDNKRGTTWDEARFLCRRVDLKCDNEVGALYANVNLEKETTGLSGQTGTFPTVPPEETVPDPDPPVWDPVIVDPEETPGYLAAFDSVNGFYWTTNSGAAWTARNTGLSVTAFLCGAVKRGWKTMQGTSDPESCILFGGGVGFLALTRNAGKTWTSIMPTSTNITWVGDDPSLSGSITIKCVESPNDATDVIYALGDSACEKGCCALLFRSDDMGQTWTATAILSAGGGADDDGYIYPIAFISHTVVNSPGNGTVVLSDTDSITGEADDVGLQGDYTWIKDNGNPGQQNIVIDFGEFSGAHTGASKMSMNVRDYGDDPTSMPFHQQFWRAGNSVRVSLDGVTYYGLGKISNYWSSGATVAFAWGDQWHWDAAPSLPMQHWRYLKLTCDFPFFNNVANGIQGWIDTVRIANATREAGWGTVNALGLAVDFESGANIHVIYTDLGNGTHLATFDTALALVSTVDLTTDHNVTVARPRVVWQPTVTDYGDIVLLYGANANGGWIGYSDNAGATVSDESGDVADTGQVYALAATGDGAGQLAEYVAFGDGGEVYSATTLGTWTLDDTADVTPDYRGGGISLGQDTNITLLIGSGAAGAVMIETAPSPYTTYTDITNDYPTDGEVVKLEWIV